MMDNQKKVLNSKVNISNSETIILLFALCLGFIIPKGVVAQDIPTHPAVPMDGGMDIDGFLDEDIWKQSEPITGFYQFEPNEGEASSQRSEVWVLYGEGNVYIGAMLYDENPSAIERTLGRRDEYNRADWFLVSIDSYFNRRNAYTFGVNAAGVQFDALRSSEGGGGPGPTPPGMDPSWDAIWDSAVRVNDQGWSVEMRIPNSMLRFPKTEVQTWGIHFTRRIPRLSETSEWPLVPRAERSNLVAQFGHLTEIRDIQPRPNLQIRPYTVAGLNTFEDPDEPGETQVNSNIDIGGDIKVGLGPNVTLDATINPDFGQVESDPAVLNLTAFETFFDEKRPFFIEGIQIYEFSVGPGELLYTRRIGAQDPIIGAAKLSGRTENGTSFGVLGATSGSDFDPTRNFGVVTASQQFGDFSEMGAILTGYDAPARFGGRLQSASGGLDWDIRFADNRYGIEGFSAFTHRSWTDNGFDSETGFAGKVWLRKRQGYLNGFAGLDVFSDEFNPNDVGQLRENNFIANIYNLEYQLNKGEPFGPVRRGEMSLMGIQQLSYDEGLNLGLNLDLSGDLTLMNFQEIRFGVEVEQPFGGYDLFETRGLGPWARPTVIGFSGAFETDQRRSWIVSPEVEFAWHEDGGRAYALVFEADVNAGTRFSFSGSIEGEWEDNVTAWASNESFLYEGSEWFLGERSVSPDELTPTEYLLLDNPEVLDTIFSEITPFSNNTYYVPIFGSRDTRSVDFTLRSNVTFSPTLSLQIYSQLFLAKGRYNDFQVLQNRDDLVGIPQYLKRSEFTLSSLQSNFVFRWEYRPGSNIYLVWTHGRQLEDSLNPLAPVTGLSPYDRSIGNRISDTFDIFPQNAFLAKIEYTFLY